VIEQLENFLVTNLLTIILIAVAIIIVIAILLLLKKPPKKKSDSIDYLAALNYLLNGERQKAFEKLKEIVKRSTANVDAYLKIGDILRDEGQYERAIKIHRGLTARTNLSTLERTEIYRSLIKDYQSAKKYDKAIEACHDLLDLTRHELWVQEILLRIYEDKEDWEKAFDLRKKIGREYGDKKNDILALYKVEAGLKLMSKGKEHDGRVKLREAIKINKSCAPAYLNLSDSYKRENRLSDALNELKKFIERTPSLAYIAFDRIKDILFEIGDFGEIESIYTKLLQTNPNIYSIRYALADVLERKGEIDKAIELCEEELEQNPDSTLARQYLIKYYTQIKDNYKAIELSLELVDESLSKGLDFSCKKCGHITNKPCWHCPQCGEWNSYLT
jgi:lipopolysaccharide biosynthesis regulator YciM